MSQHGNDILSAGNYVLNTLSLHSLVSGKRLDLTNLFKRIEIYEDMFSPYITAKVYIQDGFNFPERFPITGQEKIEISFKTDVNALPLVELSFRLYKFDGHQISENGKSQEYVLHLMSESGYLNFSQYCGYALNGPVSEMVGTVFKKHFDDSVWKDRLEVESTRDNYSLVVSKTYTPFKAVNWLTSRAISRTGKDYSPFMFYETLDGHRFKSLSKIIEDGSKNPVTYLYTIGNIGIAEGSKQDLGFKSVLPNRYHKIQKLEELGRFDAVENIMTGLVAARMQIHDLLRKEDRHVQFSESDVFDNMRKLGDQQRIKQGDSLLTKSLKTGGAYFYMPTTPYTVFSKGNPIEDNFQTEALFLKRNYHMGAFLTQKVVMQIFGDSRRRVGDVVKISVPKPQSDVTTLQDQEDKNLSGEFLITSIRHTLGTAYSCKMELSRNGMGV